MLVWQACQFLDQEAEVSEDDVSTDDDDDGSDLDSLDGSFIDDDTQLTQAPAADHGINQYIYCHSSFSTDMSILFLAKQDVVMICQLKTNRKNSADIIAAFRDCSPFLLCVRSYAGHVSLYFT